MENYNDFDIHESIQVLAVSLGIPVSGKDDCALLDEIDERCQEAGDILREKVFTKDLMSDYINRNPHTSTIDGLIIVDGDQRLTEFWEKQVILDSGLHQAVQKYKSESSEQFE